MRIRGVEVNGVSEIVLLDDRCYLYLEDKVGSRKTGEPMTVLQTPRDLLEYLVEVEG